MAVKRYIILTVCLLCFFITDAQTSAGPILSLHREGDSLTRVDFSWHSGPNLMTVGWSFSVLFDDWHTGTLHFNTGKVGAPDLPTTSTLIFLPAGSILEVKDFNMGEFLWKGMVPSDLPLVPVISAWSKEQGWPGYEPDEKIYATDTFYRGGEPIEIENLGRMGNKQVFRLTLHPVAYNPVSGDLMVDTVITATLKAPTSTAPTPPVSPRLLIVSRPEFETGIQPFVQWKRQEGYDVEELYASTRRRDSIKELIRPYFVNASLLEPAPRYILLVGDAAQIQSFSGETDLDGEGHTTDLYYSEFTGDYLPEAMLGRWPVNDTSELRIVVEKTLRYEQLKEMDTLQLKRMLLVAGKETTTPAPLTTNGQVNYVGNEIKLAHPEIDTVCYRNPHSGDQLGAIQTAIGQGAGLLNYTAHCTTGGWTSPALTIGRVEEASGTQPMVYVNNCCKSNTFGGTCFGEQLLRLPTGGAVGVIGATNSTLWYEDYYWAVGPKHPVGLTAAYDSLARGAFDALVGRQPSVTTMGELLTAGNLAVTEQGTSYAKLYWEIYCLLGDPTLRPWIGVPQHIDLALTDSVRNGQGTVSVSGTAGATVTAMQGIEVIGHTVIDATGRATLSLSSTLDTLPLILTATGAGLWPRFDTLSVKTDIAIGATLREVEASDTAISCVVENIGHQRIDSLKIILAQLGDDTLNGALLQEQTATLDSLLPGARQTVILPLAVNAVGAYPLWQATLMTWTDSHGTLSELTLLHGIPVAYPTLTLKLLDARGREARRVLPGRGYRLSATAGSSGDSLRISIEAPYSAERWTTADSTLAFTTPDSLCALAIDAISYLDRWQERQHYWLEPGNRIESFEYGFDSHPWNHDSHAPWTLDSTESHSGRYSARSGAIGDGQATRLCLEVEMLLRDTISYWVKTSTENGGDKLIFSVDGRDFIPEAWGLMEWNQRVHLLEAGHHTLCWRYKKDESGSQGNDCAWIDDLQIPLAKWDTAYVWDCQAITVGIDDPPLSTLHTPLSIYPNPTTGEMWIGSRQECTVRISDALGRLLATLQLQEGETRRWDTSALPAGVYFATTIYGSLQNNTQKIILLTP